VFSKRRRGMDDDDDGEKEAVPGLPPPYGSELQGAGGFAGGVMGSRGPYVEAEGDRGVRYSEMPGAEGFRSELDAKR
jgi:hypothetical protein